MKPSFPFFTILLAGLLALAILTAWLPARPVSASQTTPAPSAAQPACDPARSVQVSGVAVINVTPDRALLQLGVVSNAATVQQVEQMNSAAMQAVTRAVLAAGVDAKDIATDWYGIEPIYANYDALNIKGYRINNALAITLRDVSKTSRVLAAALEAGANQVINVEFYTSELRKYRDQARENAMQAAREKAEALASAAGAQAGCVLNITESSSSSYTGWWYGSSRLQNVWAQNSVQNISPSAGTPGLSGDEPLSLGQISVRAEVSASFALHE